MEALPGYQVMKFSLNESLSSVNADPKHNLHGDLRLFAHSDCWPKHNLHGHLWLFAHSDCWPKHNLHGDLWLFAHSNCWSKANLYGDLWLFAHSDCWSKVQSTWRSVTLCTFRLLIQSTIYMEICDSLHIKTTFKSCRIVARDFAKTCNVTRTN